jgi:EamA domain-containing membrane protein RarD
VTVISPVASRPAGAALRLAWLHAVSRQLPAALGLLAALGALLYVALHDHWSIAGGRGVQLLIPLTIETGAAAIIAVSTYGPFGDPERATGRWLPWLRFCAAAALTTVALGAFAGGATGGLLPGGTLALLRYLAGTTGLGLLSAVVLGGAFGWVGPMAYLLITEVALTGDSTTPWIWAARPPHDRGAAICAGLIFAVGVIATTALGARNAGRRSGPQ